MQKSRKLPVAVCAAMMSVAAVGGAMAYLADTSYAENVMVTGQVQIEQLEYERVVDADGNWVSTGETDEYGYVPDQLQAFTQEKEIVPAVYKDGKVKWDDRNGSQAASGAGSHQQSWAEIGAPGSNQLFDDSMKNVQDKFVFVKNTGDADAYYRTVIAYECPEGFDSDLIVSNGTGNSRFDWSDGDDAFFAEIDGKRYLISVATYNEVLAAGETSRPSLLQVALDPEAGNDDVALLDGSLDILVLSQAVQAAGFDDAESALTAEYGELNAENVAEWFAEVQQNA